jgi:hypothetical protein
VTYPARFNLLDLIALILFGKEYAIAKLKKYKSPGIDQIPAERLQAGGVTLGSEILSLINSVWNNG